MWYGFALAGNMQNIEIGISFYNLFEEKELFDLWQLKNYRLYVNDANSAPSERYLYQHC